MARLLKLGGALAVMSAFAPAAQGAANTPATAASLTCRGSAAAVTLGTQTIDPLVANNANDPCKTDGATVPSLAAKDALGPNTVDSTSQTAFAVSSLSGDGGPLYGQMAGSQGGLENLDLNLGGGALHVTAQAAYAAAGAKCSAANGTVQFPTYVKLVGLVVNGQSVAGGDDATIPVSSGLTSAFDQFSASPLGGVITVRTEKVLSSSTGVTVEAARIELLDASGAPVVTVVIGSAKAGIRGDVCHRGDDGSDANGNFGSTTTTPGGATGSTGSGTTGTGTSGTAGSSTGTTTSANSLGAPRPNGRNASTCARMRIFWSLPKNGVSGPERMHSGPKRITSQWMTRKVVRGKLVNCKGKPIIGAKLTLLNYKRGNLRLVKTGVKTHEDGAFMMITPDNYTTRRLVFSYRTYLNRPKVAARGKLRIVVYKHGRLVK